MIILLNNHHDLVLQSLELLKPDEIWIIGCLGHQGSCQSQTENLCPNEIKVLCMDTSP